MQKVINFIKEVMVEFKNITWPKKETLIQLTVVVISVSIIVSIILGGFDYLFTNSITLLDQTVNQPSVNQEVAPLQMDVASPSAVPTTK